MRIIIVGGGLAGLSAAHTVLERGGSVLLLDKNSFLGGNSTKATSGINGAGTRQQRALNINDNVDIFENDTAVGGKTVPANPLMKVLTHDSGAAVEWLSNRFGLDLSLVSRLGGHSQPRTHRGKERFPGMTITYALMEKLEEIAKTSPKKAQILVSARVTKYITDQKTGAVVGVTYEKGGKSFNEHGPVIVATGGYAADFTEDSLLKKYRPDLLDMNLPTTNGEHCTGDGIKMALQIGAGTTDLEFVQVHPTGLVHPDEPENKWKFLAAEALRGVGGLLLDKDGNRFCNELGTRDYVTGCMWKQARPPYRLVLNSKAGKEIQWHCTHYTGRGLMKHFKTGADLAAEMKIDSSKLKSTFDSFNQAEKSKNDVHGRKFFNNMPWDMNDNFWVAIVCPVLHYCMGGLTITPEAECVDGKTGKVLPGLFAAGEVAGGIHGKNRLGGSSLLDCVVFGRVAGATASRYLLEQVLARPAAAVGAQPVAATVSVDPASNKVHLELSWNAQDQKGGAPAPAAAAPAAAPAAAAAEEKKKPAQKEYTLADVAKHNKATDCWVVVNGQVLDVTDFMKDHPGGKQAIMLFAGKDATTEFNLLHKPDVVEKYAPNTIIGTLKGGAAAGGAHKINSHL